MTDPDEASEPATAPDRPSLPRVIGEGIAVGVALGLIGFMLVATPVYMVRAIDLAGDARTWVRNGILRGAVPFGVLVAVVGGALVGRWRWRGGRLEEGR